MFAQRNSEGRSSFSTGAARDRRLSLALAFSRAGPADACLSTLPLKEDFASRNAEPYARERLSGLRQIALISGDMTSTPAE